MLEQVELPLPRMLMPLPDGIQARSAMLSLSAESVVLHFSGVRMEDAEGRFALSSPHVTVDMDGRIDVDRAELDLSAREAAAPQRRDAWAKASAIRDAIVEALSMIPLERIGSISLGDVDVSQNGEPWTRGVRLDLSHDGDRLRGLVHLGSSLPQAELFVAIDERSIELEAELGPLGNELDGGRLHAMQRFDDPALEIEQLELLLDGTKIEGAGRLAPASFEVDAHADRAGLAWIKKHWPAELAPDARSFIERRIPRGVVSNAHVTATEETLALDFAFFGVGAQIPSVPVPISRARGRGRVTLDRLDLEVAGAQVGELSSRGQVALSGLRSPGELTVEADLAGPASAAMQLLNHTPFTPDQVDGETELRVELAVPFDRRLHTSALHIDVNGQGRHLALRGVRLFDRFTLTDGDVAISFDGDECALEGTAMIDGVPMAIAWQSPDRIRARATVGPEERRALGIEEIDGITGPIRVDLSLDLEDEITRMAGTLDLGPSTLAMPLLGFAKPAGAEANARFAGEVEADGSLSVHRFQLRARELTAEGSIELDRGQRLSAVRARVHHGANDFSVRLYPRRTVLFGASFDARPMLQQMGAEQGDHAGVDRRIELDVGRMVVARDVHLDRVSGVVQLRSGRVAQAAGTARMGGASLSVQARRRGELLRIAAKTDDAGKLARALGIETSISGGRTRIDGMLSPDLSFTGQALVRDVAMHRPPTALSAASATSIKGITDLIRENRLHFGRADVRFAVKGERLTIAKAVFSRGPIGLATQGEIDLGDGSTHLVARVAPLDDLNHALRQIPLLGRLLAPEGDGLLIAPSYSVEGDLDEPKVRLQPHSLLPAFLRRLFDKVTDQ